MPLVTPALSALAIFTFLGNWTAFPKYIVRGVMLAGIKGLLGGQWPPHPASSLGSALPRAEGRRREYQAAPPGRRLALSL